MLKPLHLDRRAVLVGGLSLPLVGCEPQPQTFSSDTPIVDNQQPEIREVIATIGMAAQAVQVFGTLVGSPQIALAGGSIAKLARFAGLVERFLRAFDLAAADSTRRAPSFLDWVIPPAHAAASYPSQDGAANATGPAGAMRPPSNLNTVSFLGGQTAIQLDCRNRTSTDFLSHNVFSVIRPIDQPRPMYAHELTGPDSLPSFSISMPVNGSYQNPMNFERPVDQGYAAYTWCIPAEVSLTDQVVAQAVMLGPLFYNCDPYDYELTNAVQQAAQSTIPPRLEYELLSG